MLKQFFKSYNPFEIPVFYIKKKYNKKGNILDIL